jgi:hypothetical protein
LFPEETHDNKKMVPVEQPDNTAFCNIKTYWYRMIFQVITIVRNGPLNQKLN